MAAMEPSPSSGEECKMARGKIEKRGQRHRKIKPVILIVTEGSQTEPKYFVHYRNRQTKFAAFPVHYKISQRLPRSEVSPDRLSPG